jgi:hypothetical protein
MREQLKRRFLAREIYTYVGDILVAINPFAPVPLYDDRTAEFYGIASSRANSLRPHIFAVALRAFRALVENKENQAVIISGESGAGKTENAKYFIAHLLELSKADGESTGEYRYVALRKRRHPRPLNYSKPHNKSFEALCIQTDAFLWGWPRRYDVFEFTMNSLLEPFGNAKMTANDNSSRFGKLVELHFTAQNQVLLVTLSCPALSCPVLSCPVVLWASFLCRRLSSFANFYRCIAPHRLWGRACVTTSSKRRVSLLNPLASSTFTFSTCFSMVWTTALLPRCASSGTPGRMRTSMTESAGGTRALGGSQWP